MALLKGFNKNSLERLKAGLSHPAACASSESSASDFCAPPPPAWALWPSGKLPLYMHSDMASSLDP